MYVAGLVLDCIGLVKLNDDLLRLGKGQRTWGIGRKLTNYISFTVASPQLGTQMRTPTKTGVETEEALNLSDQDRVTRRECTAVPQTEHARQPLLPNQPESR